jgi:riboflavin kinase
MRIIVKGTVFTGLGEGAYYLSQSNYIKQIQEKLGFTPYPGTLNIKIDRTEGINILKQLKSLKQIRLDPFFDGKRFYVGVTCYKAKINDSIFGAVIRADKTYYDESVLEIIAPIYLRSFFNIKDGDQITVEIFDSE